MLKRRLRANVRSANLTSWKNQYMQETPRRNGSERQAQETVAQEGPLF
jgi:hypothetical protein